MFFLFFSSQPMFNRVRVFFGLLLLFLHAYQHCKHYSHALSLTHTHVHAHTRTHTCAFVIGLQSSASQPSLTPSSLFPYCLFHSRTHTYTSHSFTSFSHAHANTYTRISLTYTLASTHTYTLLSHKHGHPHLCVFVCLSYSYPHTSTRTHTQLLTRTKKLKGALVCFGAKVNRGWGKDEARESRDKRMGRGWGKLCNDGAFLCNK